MVEKVQLVLPVQSIVAPSGSIVFVKLYVVLQIYIFGSTNLCYANLRFGVESSNESMREVCKHFNVQLIELHDIEKQNGHPSIAGMKSICDQLLEAID